MRAYASEERARGRVTRWRGQFLSGDKVTIFVRRVLGWVRGFLFFFVALGAVEVDLWRGVWWSVVALWIFLCSIV